MRILGAPRLDAAGLRLVLLGPPAAGRAHVFAWTEPERKELTGADRPLVGDAVADLRAGRPQVVTVPVAAADRAKLRAQGVALVSFTPASGGAQALAKRVR